MEEVEKENVQKPFINKTKEEVAEWVEQLDISEKTKEALKESSLTGYDVLLLTKENIKLIANGNIHDENSVFSAIQNILFEILKVNITLPDKKVITFSFDLDESNLTIGDIAKNVAQIIGKNAVYLKTLNENEIIYPNVKLVQRLLLEPEKYKELAVFSLNDRPNEQDVPYTSVPYRTYDDHNATALGGQPYSSSQYVSNLYSYQPLKSNSGEVEIQSGNAKLLEQTKDTQETPKENDTTTEMKKQNAIKSAKDKDELNSYMKKGYGNNKKNEDIPLKQDGYSKMIGQIKKNYSSERREFRPYGDQQPRQEEVGYSSTMIGATPSGNYNSNSVYDLRSKVNNMRTQLNSYDTGYNFNQYNYNYRGDYGGYNSYY